MNYRHAYHAGSFADVFKHIILCLVLSYLLKKEKPFCYLDTHAGEGIYNLQGPESQRTKEFESGVQLLEQTKARPDIVNQYLAIVEGLNHKQLKYYPGSPLIARHFIRQSDRLILNELHPASVKALKVLFRKDPQVAVHCQDGYSALKAFLPPMPRRGVILIDPPYEKKEEFTTILKYINLSIRRFAQGVYLIWYPIKDRQRIQWFEQELLQQGIDQLLMTELSLYPDDSPFALNGSGMAIVNPPWQLKEELQALLPWLLNAMDKEKRGKFRVEQLNA